MPGKPLAVHRPVVRVFAAPATECAGGITWKSAAEGVFKRLAARFGGQVAFEFVELFSSEFFQFSQVVSRLQERSAQAPIITVDDEIIQCGGKIAERTIRSALESRGISTSTGMQNAALP